MRFAFLILALLFFSMADGQRARPVNDRPLQRDTLFMKRIEIQRQYDSLIKLVSLQITVLKVEIVQLIKKTGSLETQIKQAELDLNNWIKNASNTLSVEEYKSQLFTKQFETEKKIKEMEYEIKSTHDHIDKNKVTIKELENNILELEKEKSLLLKKM